MKQIIEKLIDKNETIAFAESMTGGNLAGRLVLESNASKVLFESYIVYSNDAKINVLGVDKNLIETYGVVSNEVAYDMAKKLSIKTKNTLNIATTGYSEGDYDLVCFVGISYKNDIKTYKITLDSNKSRIKNINYTIEEIIKIVKQTLA